MSDQKAALITGASGGIGRSLVDHFKRAGYTVIATDCTTGPGDLSCDAYLQFDLRQLATDPTGTNRFYCDVNQVLTERRCSLSALVNNAAVQLVVSTENIKLEDWHTTMDVNLMAPFLLAQHFLPDLQVGSGCIINIGSIHSRLTKKGFVLYATSKAALAGLTRAMAVDLGEKVRINAIEPAAIDTEMLRQGFPEKDRDYAKLMAHHPQNKIGTPSQVAKLAVNIAQGGLDFLHGSCLSIDGGISGRLHDPE